MRGNGGELHQLSNLVSVREAVAPKELNHFNKLRAAIINGNVAEGASLGEALDYIDKVVKEELPPGSGHRPRRRVARVPRDAGSSSTVTFVLALVFIYLVLSAQFESFVGPFVIMFTVPLAMTGALLVMYINAKLGHGGTLNVYSQIGLVMLVGLITKHGILIVEFANQLQRKGMEKFEAVVEAATLRLRPILMTTAAMVLGAVPLATVAWGRRRGAPGDRLGDRGRPAARHAAHPVRDSDRLHAAGAQGAHSRRRSRRGARAAGASAAGRAVALKR